MEIILATWLHHRTDIIEVNPIPYFNILLDLTFNYLYIILFDKPLLYIINNKKQCMYFYFKLKLLPTELIHLEKWKQGQR